MLHCDVAGCENVTGFSHRDKLRSHQRNLHPHLFEGFVPPPSKQIVRPESTISNEVPNRTRSGAPSLYVLEFLLSIILGLIGFLWMLVPARWFSPNMRAILPDIILWLAMLVLLFRIFLELAQVLSTNMLAFLPSIGLREKGIPPGHQRIWWTNVSVFVVVSPYIILTSQFC